MGTTGKNAVAEQNGSSGRSKKAGGLQNEQQARQRYTICVGGSLWAVLGCQYKRISDVAGPDQETSL